MCSSDLIYGNAITAAAGGATNLYYTFTNSTGGLTYNGASQNFSYTLVFKKVSDDTVVAVADVGTISSLSRSETGGGSCCFIHWFH